MSEMSAERKAVYDTRDKQLIDNYHRQLRTKNNMLHKAIEPAHIEVNRALRLGTLIKPDKCENCQEGRKLFAHHEDYTKPLAIIWLCVPCHRKLHLHKNIYLS